MTERESEQFYHDLRHKLDNFGAPVPESVWSGIQEKMPVARRRRRPGPLLLLLLLLVGIFIYRAAGPDRLSWNGWSREKAPGATVTRLATTGEAGAATTPEEKQREMQNSGTPEKALHVEQVPGLSAATANSQSSHGLPVRELAAIPNPTYRNPAGGILLLPDSKKQELGSSSGKKNQESTPSTTASKKHHRGNRLAVLAALAQGRPRTSHASRLLREETAETMVNTSDANSNFSKVDREYRPAVKAPAQAVNNPDEQSRYAGQRRRQPVDSEGLISNAPLAFRSSLSELETEPMPSVQNKRQPRPKRTFVNKTLQRMAVEVVLGKGISYRTLGGPATQLQNLERPAGSFAGHAGVSYELNERLQVNAAVGYAVFATKLDYELRKTSQDLSKAISFRDVHQYFTIPVELQYGLVGNHRWNIGTTGGAMLALRTGSRTTEGTACSCSQQEWSPGLTSPYRSTSVALTAGAFANYQMAVGQWLTFRPQGQYFLSSITNPSKLPTTRRPFNVGLEMGLIWELSPRKLKPGYKSRK